MLPPASAQPPVAAGVHGATTWTSSPTAWRLAGAGRGRTAAVTVDRGGVAVDGTRDSNAVVSDNRGRVPITLLSPCEVVVAGDSCGVRIALLSKSEVVVAGDSGGVPIAVLGDPMLLSPSMVAVFPSPVPQINSVIAARDAPDIMPDRTSTPLRSPSTVAVFPLPESMSTAFLSPVTVAAF